MKKLGPLNKFIFFLNSLAAVLLLLTFVLPFVSPKSFPTLSILSLLVSPLLIINALFVIYWLLGLRKQLLLSAIMIVLALFHFNSFFNLGESVSEVTFNNELSILSYNVHLFNAYNGGDFENSEIILNEIVQEYQPDILAFQEYNDTHAPAINGYPFSYVHFKTTTRANGKVKKKALGHAIFSKYPLINKGAFDFNRTTNNTLYVDVIKDNDTIRLYNMHLRSFGISPNVSTLQEGDKEKLIGRMANAFEEQASQVAAVLNHKNNSPHPVVMTGDFNNTAFSYIYKQLTEGMNDAFVECGGGLGTTFKFDGYPLRIDYILAQTNFEIISFKTIDKTFSDHQPIKATIGWN